MAKGNLKNKKKDNIMILVQQRRKHRRPGKMIIMELQKRRGSWKGLTVNKKSQKKFQDHEKMRVLLAWVACVLQCDAKICTGNTNVWLAFVTDMAIFLNTFP